MDSIKLVTIELTQEDAIVLGQIICGIETMIGSIESIVGNDVLEQIDQQLDDDEEEEVAIFNQHLHSDKVGSTVINNTTINCPMGKPPEEKPIFKKVELTDKEKILVLQQSEEAVRIMKELLFKCTK